MSRSFVKAFVCIFILSLSKTSYSIEVPNVDPCSESYAIKEFKPIDPRGDFCIAELGLRVGKQVINIILNRQKLRTTNDSFDMIGEAKTSHPSTTNEINKALASHQKENIIEGRIAPLKPFELVNMFAQVMLEENLKHGFKTEFGTVHKWSDEFVKSENFRKRYYAIGPIYGSKVLLALSMGAGIKFIPSGREDELASWILAQNDNSITLESLFRKSYFINKGDVYLTILTISNYLSYNWRDPNRANLEFIKKLTSITNRWQGRGDTFGAWYHLFGIMLYGYIKGETKAKLVAHTESLMSYAAASNKDEIEEQEDYINYQGAIVGGRLAQLTVAWPFLSWPDKPERKSPLYYLNLTEDFRDRIPYEPNPNYETSNVNFIDYTSDDQLDANYSFTIKPIGADVPKNSCDIEVLPKYSFKSKFNSNDMIKLKPIDLLDHKPTQVNFTASSKINQFRVFINCK